MAVAPDPAAVADKIALTELTNQLERAVDRKDHAGIVACYSERSFDDHGRFRGSREAFADFVCNSPYTAASAFIFHLMGQSTWEVEGDEAFGESYYSYWMQGPEGRLFQSIGRYLDYCERAEDGWRITYRRVVVDWDGTMPREDAIPGGHFRGAQGPTDPSYKRLTWPENPDTKTSIG